MKTLQELADEGILFQSHESELVKQNMFAIIKDASIATPIARQVAAVIQMNNGATLDFELADKDSVTVREVGEGAEVPIDYEQYTQLSVTPKIYGVRLAITKRMIEDSNFELIQRNLREAGRRMGLQEDTLLLAQFDDSTNGFPSVSNHSFNSDGAELAISDITEAMRRVEEEDYNPNTMLLHPTQVDELRNIDTFVEADKVGNRNAFENGFVGKIFGMDVFRTSQVTEDRVYVFDRDETAGLVIRRPLTVEKLSDPIRDLEHAIVTSRMAAVVFRPQAGARIVVI